MICEMINRTNSDTKYTSLWNSGVKKNELELDLTLKLTHKSHKTLSKLMTVKNSINCLI